MLVSEVAISLHPVQAQRFNLGSFYAEKIRYLTPAQEASCGSPNTKLQFVLDVNFIDFSAK